MNVNTAICSHCGREVLLGEISDFAVFGVKWSAVCSECKKSLESDLIDQLYEANLRSYAYMMEQRLKEQRINLYREW